MRPGPSGLCSASRIEMARIIVLDAGPLGLASQAPGIARAD